MSIGSVAQLLSKALTAPWRIFLSIIRLCTALKIRILIIDSGELICGQVRLDVLGWVWMSLDEKGGGFEDKFICILTARK